MPTDLVFTCRELRADLELFSKSPLTLLNPRGRLVLQRTQILLTQLEDLADRVVLLESRDNTT